MSEPPTADQRLFRVLNADGSQVFPWIPCDVGYLDSELVRICHTNAFLEIVVFEEW